MVYRKTSLIKFAALVLTTAALVPAASTLTPRESVYAQSFGENPTNFPIPESLPDGSKLAVDGSTSMEVTNQELEGRYEKQYPTVDVQLNATRTDEAIAALLRGDVDVVATGRPLTDAEKAQGLVEVPLEREKLAIVLGANNPYQGEITFDQFARIFRGEITNWSELGGPDKPIRVVDRPDFSDTRRALSTYEVFKSQPFETGATADPVSEDATDVVVSALGDDGIGYAVYSQVEGRSDVRILDMHGTLPDDPRYPYSQHRAYVFKEGATPATLAFLGFALTRPGEEVVTSAPAATADATPPEAGATADATAPDAAATAEPDAAGSGGSDDTALVPGTGTETTRDRGGFPWWLLLLPLLLLPFLLLRGKKAAPVPAAVPAPVPVPPPVPLKATPRMVLTPRNCRDAYAYWELPSDRLEEAKASGRDGLKVRLYDVTDRAKTAALPPHAAEFDCVNTEPDLHLPIAVDNRDYLAEVGYVTSDNRWVPLAKSEPVRVPACAETERVPGTGLGGMVPAVAGVAAAGAAGAALLRRPTPARMVLTPRNCRDAYAYWELPSDRLDEAKAKGQGGLKVRLYDVTGRAKNAALPDAIAEFDCHDNDPDLHVPISVDDRDYCAEVGYLNANHHWVPLAKSEPVRVPACPAPSGDRIIAPETAISTPGLGLAVPAAGLGAAALGTAGAAALVGKRPGIADPRMVLVPRNPHDLYAYWEVPESRLEDARRQGGETLMVRLYDVTNRLPGTPLPVHAKQLAVTGTEPDLHISVEENNRDYLAELGYLTADNRWLPVVKSGTVHLPGDTEAQTSEETPGATFPGAAIAGAVTAGAAAVGAGVVGAVERLKGDDQTGVTSRIVLTPRTANKGYAYWETPDGAKAALRAEGGQDLKLRVYDATDIDLDRQPPHSFVTYDVLETEQDRFVPLPESDRDYVAEIGYTTAEGGWLCLARSLPVRSDRILGKPSEGSSNVALDTHPCSIQTVKVHSQNHAVLLDEGQMRHLQEKVATNYYLSPGQYILRIRDGVFNYDGDDTHPGEPFVLLWIYGGRVINQKTGVPVQATWSTLNGYADTLVLDVQDPATLCAFFMDTYPDDNVGEVTLSVIKL